MTACTLMKAFDLTEEAFEIAVENKTSYYDSLFLAAAQEKEMPLLTLDRKLYEKVKAKRDVRLV
jgi:predicted nucleic acid-binding protein